MNGFIKKEVIDLGRPLIDLTGKRFGKLTVVKKSNNISSNGSPKWIVSCDCGNCEIEMDRSNLLKSKTCGKCKNINKYEKHKDYMVGICSNGTKFYFDESDFDTIKKYTWSVTGSNYVCTQHNKKFILMHRLLLDAPNHLQVDHINHNTLDNRRCNIRLSTVSQNNVNKNFKGYTRRKNGKFEVSMRINGKYSYLGRFNTEKEAKKYRNEIARKVYGDFVYDENVVQKCKLTGKCIEKKGCGKNA